MIINLNPWMQIAHRIIVRLKLIARKPDRLSHNPAWNYYYIFIEITRCSQGNFSSKGFHTQAPNENLSNTTSTWHPPRADARLETSVPNRSCCPTDPAAWKNRQQSGLQNCSHWLFSNHAPWLVNSNHKGRCLFSFI